MLDHKEWILLPALVAWVTLGGKQPVWNKYLFFQLILAAGTEFLATLLIEKGLSNHWLYNGYMILEFVSLHVVIRTSHASRAAFHRYEWLFLTGFIVTFLYETATGGFNVFATRSLSVGGVLLATQSALACYGLMMSTQARLIGEPLFWIYLSITAYFMGFVPVFILYNHLTEHNPDLAEQVLSLNDILFVLRYGLVTFGLVLLHRRP